MEEVPSWSWKGFYSKLCLLSIRTNKPYWKVTNSLIDGAWVINFQRLKKTWKHTKNCYVFIDKFFFWWFPVHLNKLYLARKGWSIPLFVAETKGSCLSSSWKANNNNNSITNVVQLSSQSLFIICPASAPCLPRTWIWSIFGKSLGTFLEPMFMHVPSSLEASLFSLLSIPINQAQLTSLSWPSIPTLQRDDYSHFSNPGVLYLQPCWPLLLCPTDHMDSSGPETFL